jgi:hypothetical protein
VYGTLHCTLHCAKGGSPIFQHSSLSTVRVADVLLAGVIDFQLFTIFAAEQKSHRVYFKLHAITLPRKIEYN